MTKQTEIAGGIQAFLLQEILDAGADQTLAANEDLIEGGFIDSTGALRIATHLEQTYGIEITPLDFTIENFRSVQALSKLVIKKREVD